MKTLLKRITCALLAALLIASALPALAAPAFAEDANRTVKVGFFAFPGYHEFEGGVRSGYGYDFLQLLRRYTDLNFEYVGYGKSWEDMQRMLLDGEIDLVTSAGRTEAREELFDFSEPIGKYSVQINVRADDDRFAAGDYAALDGITIGVISGSTRNDSLALFAGLRGFSYVTLSYADSDELAAALRNGRVDAAVTSSLRKSEGERTVAEFDTENFYAIVRKGDTELLDEINYGIIQMDLNLGDWQSELNYRNYRTGSGEVLSFTEREKALIGEVRSGGRKITVTARPDRAPYSFVENGRLKGIIPDYFARLMELAGLPYTLLLPEDGADYLEWAEDNRTDVVMDCPYASSPSADLDFGVVTSSFMEMTVSRVTRKGFSRAARTVAVFDSPDSPFLEDDDAGKAVRLTVDGPEAAMQAVSDGAADSCCVYTYTAERVLNANPNSNLQSVVLSSPAGGAYLYVSPDTPHELCSILDKCIRSDSGASLDELVRNYTSPPYENLTPMQYLRLHPELVIAGAAVLLLLIVVIAIMVGRARTERMRNAQLEERLEHQQQIEDALARAESANRAKTEFLFNMSHDIRTPMNAILGFTNIARKHIDDRTKVEDCLVKTQQSGNLLLTLINSILDMSRIESGSAEIQWNKGDVMLSFINIESALQQFAATKDILLSFGFGEIRDRYVYTDFTASTRIFTNLISNAIKYTGEGGRVMVFCDQVGEAKNGEALYRYTVQDNGIGMSREFQEHMFEAFTREQSSTKSGVQGTGLGLSVAKTFVDYLGGTIECESEPGSGTKFTVTLPFRIQEGQEYTDPVTGKVLTGKAPEESPAPADFRGRKVLLVEDNEMNREIAVELLMDEGLEVDEAEDGSVAVELLRRKGPAFYDFILMDIQMPGMDGYEATRAIRAMYPDAGIPIIAVSANAFEEDRKASREAGMDDHIAKPINVDALFRVLAKYL